MAQIYSGNDTYLFIIIFILFVAIRRLYSGMNGRKFKESRIYTLPLIYIILLLFSLEGIYSNLDYIIIILLLIFPGIILGLRLANNVKFFNKDDNLYYKRSQIIMIFWIISFLGRMLLFTLYPSNILAGFIIDLLLSFTLGLIIGESIILYSKYKQVLNPEPNINENL